MRTRAFLIVFILLLLVCYTVIEHEDTPQKQLLYKNYINNLTHFNIRIKTEKSYSIKPMVKIRTQKSKDALYTLVVIFFFLNEFFLGRAQMKIKTRWKSFKFNRFPVEHKSFFSWCNLLHSSTAPASRCYVQFRFREI